MRNIRIDIQYLGTRYRGWQIQAEGPTIQGEIEQAIQKVTQEPVRVIGSGRTDAGVHAIRQVANFHTQTKIPLTNLQKALNSLLPDDISIIGIEEVPCWFHARKNAKKKAYLYKIMESPFKLPLALHRAWVLAPGLEIEQISQACAYLVGTHDFKGLQKSGSSVKTTVRTIYECRLEIHTFPLTRTPCIEFHVAANGFLRYMVRNIVGLLVEIGRGRLLPSDVLEILRKGSRIFPFQTAPPHGLYLRDVYY